MNDQIEGLLSASPEGGARTGWPAVTGGGSISAGARRVEKNDTSFV
jgi:hypothetical protein